MLAVQVVGAVAGDHQQPLLAQVVDHERRELPGGRSAQWRSSRTRTTVRVAARSSTRPRKAWKSRAWLDGGGEGSRGDPGTSRASTGGVAAGIASPAARLRSTSTIGENDRPLFPQRQTPAAQHRGVQSGGELGEQPRLAHAGVATDHDEPLQLHVTANKLHIGDRSGLGSEYAPRWSA